MGHQTILSPIHLSPSPTIQGDDQTIINEEIWVGLVFWVFMVLLGLRYRKEGVILSMASVLGLIMAYLILTVGWTLIGLAMLVINLYLMYDGLMAWV